MPWGSYGGFQRPGMRPPIETYPGAGGAPGFDGGFPTTAPYTGYPDPGLMTGQPTGSGTGGGGGGPLAAIGRFITQNPQLIVGLAGTAANVYGASREGKARDEENKIRREEMEKRLEEERKQREDDRIRMLLQAMTSMRPPSW